MHVVDYVIFALYMAGVLGIGFYFFRKNTSADDYYVGGRGIKSHHVGLSVVATDVGGGFSIGLGGLGYAMGLSGSWLLFSGLLGAWLTAVLIIPKLKRLDEREAMLTFPDFLRFRYDGTVAMVAAVISGLGYMGFTGGQILAGAKLASATIIPQAPWGMDSQLFAVFIIAVITIVYTSSGGLKAVIYTDTVQWIILLTGLAITVPVTIWGELDGLASLERELPARFFTLTNVSFVQVLNWLVTIIPVWFVAMTLYQRIYACENTREAKKAWFFAGLLEWPLMAFLGVILGMASRVLFPGVESELGLPLLIKTALPVVLTGLIIAAYFSAIMSTADSCLMASSGNFVGDVIRRVWLKDVTDRQEMILSQAVTLVIGVVAVLIAVSFEKVLDAIMAAYAFMVSGLFVPTLGAFFWSRGSCKGALYSMICGGGVTMALTLDMGVLPDALENLGLDPIAYGLTLSLVTYVVVSWLLPDATRVVQEELADD